MAAQKDLRQLLADHAQQLVADVADSVREGLVEELTEKVMERLAGTRRGPKHAVAPAKKRRAAR